MDELQLKAHQIMEQKVQSHPERNPRKSSLQSRQLEVEVDLPLNTSGVSHLKRLELVPDNFGMRATQEEMEEMAQTCAK